MKKQQSSILTPNNDLIGVKKSKAKIKKVMKGLQKASKTHAAQAKTLKGVLHGRSKKRNG